MNAYTLVAVFWGVSALALLFADYQTSGIVATLGATIATAHAVEEEDK